MPLFRMKTLILSVDRDDDIGQKAGVATPIVGRRRIVEAATALGVADPEDSDTNSLFAAAHLYDKELASSDGQVEVAAITGHHRMGLRADRNLANQLDEVLQLTRADEVILVSDGAEDEQIMPILMSRVKVAHVHRTIVKQAPRLEGFYYTITRLFEDKKLGKRLVLPLGIVTVLWSVAILANLTNYALAATIGIIGLWLIIHAMGWEDRVTVFFSDFADGMRSGKVSLLANMVAVVLIALGIMAGFEAIDGQQDGILRALLFLKGFIMWLVSALLVRTAGILFDGWIRDGRASLTHWTAAFTLVAVGLIGSAVLQISIAVREKTPFTEILDPVLLMRLFIGILIAMGGLVLARYVRNFFDDESAVAK